jgi:TPR repeat protein
MSVLLLLVCAACQPAPVPQPATPVTRSSVRDLDPEDALGQAVLAALLPPMTHAWRRWLTTDPSSEFLGSVDLVVNRDGHISQARVVRIETTPHAAFFFILEELSTVRFPSTQLETGVRMRVNLRFSPDERRPIALAMSSTRERREDETDRVACRAGTAAACVRAGIARHEDALPDNGHAAEYFAAACNTNTTEGAEGCLRLGRAYELGLGVVSDLAKAARHYAHGCDLDVVMGCGEIGRFYRDGLGGLTKDDARAAALFDRACAAKDYAGCANLGEAYAKGLGASPAPAKALALFQLACDHSDALGCYRLAFRHEIGDGVVQDVAKAVTLYDRSCAAGHMDACVHLGELRRDGSGVPKAFSSAVGLFKKACDGKSALGCRYLAALYREGDGVERDSGKSLEYYKRACTLGDANACAARDATK